MKIVIELNEKLVKKVCEDMMFEIEEGKEVIVDYFENIGEEELESILNIKMLPTKSSLV